MSEPSKHEPPVIILSGPQPDAPELFCATCAMIYMGALSANEAVQKEVQARTEKAYEQGKVLVAFTLEHLITLAGEHRDLRLFLHHAVTVAPSTHFDEPMPVCWSHIKGWRQVPNRPFPSGLIAGKKHTIPRPAGSG